MMISFIRIAADLGDRRPVSRRIATLRETPWPQHRQIYPFRRWAGEAQACPAQVGYLRVGVRPRAQALAELLDLGCADAGMTTDLDPLIVTAWPGIGIKKRTREVVAPLAGATKILGVCP
jgi:hypothetical protein